MNKNNHSHSLAQRSPAPAPAPQGWEGTDGQAGQPHTAPAVTGCPPARCPPVGPGAGGQHWWTPADEHTDTHPCQARRTRGQPRHEAPAGTQQHPRVSQTFALCRLPPLRRMGPTASSPPQSLPVSLGQGHGAEPPPGCCSPDPGSVPAAPWHRCCPSPRTSAGQGVVGGDPPGQRGGAEPRWGRMASLQALLPAAAFA